MKPHDSVAKLVRAFDPTIPLPRAVTPPAAWYTRRGVASLERRSVFSHTWQLLGRAADLQVPGDFVEATVAGEPLLAVRGTDGELHAYANVCRHKASTLVEGGRGNVASAAGGGCGDDPTPAAATGADGTRAADVDARSARRQRLCDIVCPCHGWRYSVDDGALRAAPEIAGMENLNPKSMGLPELRVEQWGPWVWVNRDRNAEPLSSQLAPLGHSLDASGWDGLQFRGAREWHVACNWKVFCDNYLDGGYHIPHMHPSLDDQLDLGSYTTTLYDTYSVQASGASTDAAGDRIGDDGALYAWVYPNFMLNRYGPTMDMNLVLPRGPDACTVRFEWYFDPSVGPDDVTASIEQSCVTQEEDILISERVQAGLKSSYYDVGRYAPSLEGGVHHFHRLLAEDLSAALEDMRR